MATAWRDAVLVARRCRDRGGLQNVAHAGCVRLGDYRIGHHGTGLHHARCLGDSSVDGNLCRAPSSPSYNVLRDVAATYVTYSLALDIATASATPARCPAQ